MFYTPGGMRAEYREEPCRSALNRVRGMPFAWSLNPYMGCVHRCTFCYVRAFEARAARAPGGGSRRPFPLQGTPPDAPASPPAPTPPALLRAPPPPPPIP